MRRKKRKDGQWDIVIKPRTGWFDINFKEIWQYRDLILLFVKRNFTVLYKQTILGPAWAIIQPLLTTTIFTVVFGGIANLPTDGMPQFLFYMCGNVAWSYFATCLEKTSQTFVTNAKVFGKVYFPRLTAPISVVIQNLINFGIQAVFFLIILLFFRLQPNTVVHPNWQLILLTPAVILEMALLGLGVGIIIAALTIKYRDLALLISFGVQLWMYATPVAYPSSMIAEKFPQLMGVYMLNPMAPIIEFFRAAYLGSGAFNGQYFLIGTATTVVVLFVGIILFSRHEKTFMDTV